MANTIERMTPQKQIVLDHLKSVKTHPTAESVWNHVTKSMPNISQGTVYRILGNLLKKGEVQAISTKDSVHFDGDMKDHAHFICETCGKIYDIFDVCSKCEILKNKKIKVGKINNFKIIFYGKCSGCKTIKQLSN